MFHRIECFEDCGELNNPRLKVKDVIFRLSHVFNSEILWKKMRDVPSFFHSSNGETPISGKEFEEIFKTNPIIAELRFFKSHLPWARRTYTDKRIIYINELDIPEHEAEVAKAIAHEYVHVLELFVTDYIGHGSDKTNNQDLSIPCRFAKAVEDSYNILYVNIWKKLEHSK